MNRRNIFKFIGGALCAAAIEITGVRPSLPKFDPSEYEGHIVWSNIRHEIRP
jgi:hypothetical protein